MITSPYRVNDYHDNQMKGFRPETPNSHNKKIILRHFETDNERVKKYLQTQSKIKKYEHFSPDHTIQKKQNIIYKKDKEDCITQPLMKFKPRTDIERVIDTINSNYYGRIDNKLIKEQCKALGFNKFQKAKKQQSCEYSNLKEKLKVNEPTLNYLIKEKARLEKSPQTPEIEELIATMNNIIKINKEIIYEQNLYSLSEKQVNSPGHKTRINRRKINNYLSSQILEEYQKKFHFKATTTYSLNITNEKFDDTPINNININNNKDYNLTSGNSISENKNNEDNSIYRNKNKNKIINNTCTLFYRSFHKPKNDSKEKTEYLEKLINKGNDKINSLASNYQNGRDTFMKRDSVKNSSFDPEDSEEKNKRLLARMNIITINGVNYNKNDLPKLSKIVLRKCNLVKKHFKVPKAGNGKTMITRGLTVNLIWIQFFLIIFLYRYFSISIIKHKHAIIFFLIRNICFS